VLLPVQLLHIQMALPARVVHLTRLRLLHRVVPHRAHARQTRRKMEHVLARAIIGGHVHWHAKRVDRIVGVVVACEHYFRAPSPLLLLLLRSLNKLGAVVIIAKRGNRAAIAAAVEEFNVTVGANAWRSPDAAHAQPGVAVRRVIAPARLAADALRIAAGLGHIGGDQRTAYVQAKVEPAISARHLKNIRKYDVFVKFN
jgi:hypothetical protein